MKLETTYNIKKRETIIPIPKQELPQQHFFWMKPKFKKKVNDLRLKESEFYKGVVLYQGSNISFLTLWWKFLKEYFVSISFMSVL